MVDMSQPLLFLELDGYCHQLKAQTRTFRREKFCSPNPCMCFFFFGAEQGGFLNMGMVF